MTSGRWSAILEFVVKPAAGTVVVVVEAAKTQAVVEAEPVVATPVVDASSTPVVTLDRAAVQAFMINYVVDQTGYPAEMVEMTRGPRSRPRDRQHQEGAADR
jgi:hypothetical protein